MYYIQDTWQYPGRDQEYLVHGPVTALIQGGSGGRCASFKTSIDFPLMQSELVHNLIRGLKCAVKDNICVVSLH